MMAARHPPGVVRSPQQPEETRGLTRSGDLSRMLPFEAHLLAAGWPRKQAASSGSSEEEGEGSAPVVVQGSQACRRLFMARRAGQGVVACSCPCSAQRPELACASTPQVAALPCPPLQSAC